MKQRLLPVALLGLAFHLSGCAAAIPILGAGAGMFADRGIDHIIESTASKTFAAPLEEVRVAMLQSCHRMELAIQSDERTDSGYAVTGKTKDRRVEIELEQVGAQFTYMQVQVKRNFFRRDRATAAALVAATDSTLAQVRLASQNGAHGANLPRVSVADVLRPVSLARNGRPAWYSRSDEVRSSSPAPLPILSASMLAAAISQTP
jgi:hypothetical protein